MDTDSAYLTKSQYAQSNWFSNKSNINIIYNISVITITITMSIILANFGKYAISDCLFITCQNYHFGKYVGWSCLLLAKIYILASMFVGHVCLFVCLFVTCRNLHFGKYVRWSCLLLAKIWFWQVCSLVLFVTCQNLILASMFVGLVCLFVTCQNLHFGKYVRWSCLFVCLCVCLFVRKFHKISRTTQSIITKLSHK